MSGIQYGDLSRGRRYTGLFKMDVQFRILKTNSCRSGCLPIIGLDPDLFRPNGTLYPGVDQSNPAGVSPQLTARADNQVVGSLILVHNIQGFAVGNSQPPPLSQSMPVQALMPAQDFSAGIHYISRSGQSNILSGQKFAVIVAGDKADFLAFPALYRPKSPSGQGPMNRFLGPGGQRKQCILQYALVHKGQKIALILASIHSPEQSRRVIAIPPYLGVVSGCYMLDTQGLDFFSQGPEFDPSVAPGAWIRCQPLGIGLDKRIDHFLGKDLFHVHTVQRHIQAPAYPGQFVLQFFFPSAFFQK